MEKTSEAVYNLRVEALAIHHDSEKLKPLVEQMDTGRTMRCKCGSGKKYMKCCENKVVTYRENIQDNLDRLKEIHNEVLELQSV